MLTQQYTSYAGIGMLAPPHSSQSAVLLVHISHSIPAYVSIYSGLYKTGLSSPLPHLLQVLTQSHTTVNQPANITDVVLHLSQLLTGRRSDKIVACINIMSYHPRYSWLAQNYQSVSDDLDALQPLCEQTLQQQQQQQQKEEKEEEHPPTTSADAELRQFLIGGGLLDQDETLSQSLDRLEQMCTEALQEPSATSTAMQGQRFIF